MYILKKLLKYGEKDVYYLSPKKGNVSITKNYRENTLTLIELGDIQSDNLKPNKTYTMEKSKLLNERQIDIRKNVNNPANTKRCKIHKPTIVLYYIYYNNISIHILLKIV